MLSRAKEAFLHGRDKSSKAESAKAHAKKPVDEQLDRLFIRMNKACPHNVYIERHVKRSKTLDKGEKGDLQRMKYLVVDLYAINPQVNKENETYLKCMCAAKRSSKSDSVKHKCMLYLYKGFLEADGLDVLTCYLDHSNVRLVRWALRGIWASRAFPDVMSRCHGEIAQRKKSKKELMKEQLPFAWYIKKLTQHGDLTEDIFEVLFEILIGEIHLKLDNPVDYPPSHPASSLSMSSASSSSSSALPQPAALSSSVVSGVVSAGSAPVNPSPQLSAAALAACAAAQIVTTTAAIGAVSINVKHSPSSSSGGFGSLVFTPSSVSTTSMLSSPSIASSSSMAPSAFNFTGMLMSPSSASTSAELTSVNSNDIPPPPPESPAMGGGRKVHVMAKRIVEPSLVPLVLSALPNAAPRACEIALQNFVLLLEEPANNKPVLSRPNWQQLLMPLILEDIEISAKSKAMLGVEIAEPVKIGKRRRGSLHADDIKSKQFKLAMALMASLHYEELVQTKQEKPGYRNSVMWRTVSIVREHGGWTADSTKCVRITLVSVLNKVRSKARRFTNNFDFTAPSTFSNIEQFFYVMDTVEEFLFFAPIVIPVVTDPSKPKSRRPSWAEGTNPKDGPLVGLHYAKPDGSGRVLDLCLVDKILQALEDLQMTTPDLASAVPHGASKEEAERVHNLKIKGTKQFAFFTEIHGCLTLLSQVNQHIELSNPQHLKERDNVLSMLSAIMMRRVQSGLGAASYFSSGFLGIRKKLDFGVGVESPFIKQAAGSVKTRKSISIRGDPHGSLLSHRSPAGSPVSLITNPLYGGASSPPTNSNGGNPFANPGSPGNPAATAAVMGAVLSAGFSGLGGLGPPASAFAPFNGGSLPPASVPYGPPSSGHSLSPPNSPGSSVPTPYSSAFTSAQLPTKADGNEQARPSHDYSGLGPAEAEALLQHKHRVERGNVKDVREKGRKQFDSMESALEFLHNKYGHMTEKQKRQMLIRRRVDGYSKRDSYVFDPNSSVMSGLPARGTFTAVPPGAAAAHAHARSQSTVTQSARRENFALSSIGSTKSSAFSPPPSSAIPTAPVSVPHASGSLTSKHSHHHVNHHMRALSSLISPSPPVSPKAPSKQAQPQSPTSQQSPQLSPRSLKSTPLNVPGKSNPISPTHTFDFASVVNNPAVANVNVVGIPPLNKAPSLLLVRTSGSRSPKSGSVSPPLSASSSAPSPIGMSVSPSPFGNNTASPTSTSSTVSASVLSISAPSESGVPSPLVQSPVALSPRSLAARTGGTSGTIGAASYSSVVSSARQGSPPKGRGSPPLPLGSSVSIGSQRNLPLPPVPTFNAPQPLALPGSAPGSTTSSAAASPTLSSRMFPGSASTTSGLALQVSQSPSLPGSGMQSRTLSPLPMGALSAAASQPTSATPSASTSPTSTTRSLSQPQQGFSVSVSTSSSPTNFGRMVFGASSGINVSSSAAGNSATLPPTFSSQPPPLPRIPSTGSREGKSISTAMEGEADDSFVSMPKRGSGIGRAINLTLDLQSHDHMRDENFILSDIELEDGYTSDNADDDGPLSGGFSAGDRRPSEFEMSPGSSPRTRPSLAFLLGESERDSLTGSSEDLKQRIRDRQRQREMEDYALEEKQDLEQAKTIELLLLQEEEDSPPFDRDLEHQRSHSDVSISTSQPSSASSSSSGHSHKGSDMSEASNPPVAEQDTAGAFACHFCHKKLSFDDFYESNGYVLCEEHFALFACTCKVCHTSVDPAELILRVGNDIFHPECLCCFTCGKTFDGKDDIGKVQQVFERDGLYFCENDYVRASADFCHACNQSIASSEAVSITLSDATALSPPGGAGSNGPGARVSFHADCFRCVRCKRSINAKFKPQPPSVALKSLELSVSASQLSMLTDEILFTGVTLPPSLSASQPTKPPLARVQSAERLTLLAVASGTATAASFTPSAPSPAASSSTVSSVSALSASVPSASSSGATGSSLSSTSAAISIPASAASALPLPPLPPLPSSSSGEKISPSSMVASAHKGSIGSLRAGKLTPKGTPTHSSRISRVERYFFHRKTKQLFCMEDYEEFLLELFPPPPPPLPLHELQKLESLPPPPPPPLPPPPVSGPKLSSLPPLPPAPSSGVTAVPTSAAASATSPVPGAALPPKRPTSPVPASVGGPPSNRGFSIVLTPATPSGSASSSKSLPAAVSKAPR